MRKTKLLILTYYWPPAGGAGVQRWLKFVKYLSQLHYDIHVYTAENPEAPALDESLLKDVPDNIHVLKKPIWEPFGFYKKLTRKKGAFNAGFLSEEKKNDSSLAEKTAMIVRANMFIPDAKMFWIKPSIRFLDKYVKENDIQIIVSSGPPHSLHLIAQGLKEKNNIKWLADFRDPWTNIDFYKDLPMSKLVDSYQKKLEKKVLTQADKVIVVGAEMKKEFLAIQDDCNIDIITNGYDSEIAKDKHLDEKFSILHVGSINADRSHESFYKVLAELIEGNDDFEKHLQLKLIGKVDIKTRDFIAKYNLNKFTNFIAYLPYREISEIQAKAHLLYLPINNSPNAKGILTGKFFEYLAAKRPIIAQGPSDGDIAKILEETQAGEIFDFDDSKVIKDYIRQEFDHYQNKRNTFASLGIEKYSRQNLSKKLDQILGDLLNQ